MSREFLTPSLSIQVVDNAQDPLVEAVDRYLELLESGQDVNLDEFVTGYPNLGEELRDCLGALDLVGQIARRMSHEQSSESCLVTPRRNVGDFQILREIGRGGMGIVYEAEQLSLGRLVALKVLPYAAMLDQRALVRFKNEARAAATLDHANIVPVHSVGNERGIYYYAMSLINGITIQELISHLKRSLLSTGSSSNPLAIDDFLSGQNCGWQAGSGDTMSMPASDSQRQDSSDGRAVADDTSRAVTAAISTNRGRFNREFFCSIARLGAQAADALEHAHSHGVIHRDIKPGNLMIDSKTKLWITDFGLAHIESDPGMTMTGDLIGTLRYMAPEQALGKRTFVDHRADVYSLGASLYEVIALQPAFDGHSREAILKQIAFQDSKPLRQCNPRVPADLETIIQKALSKNPDDRYLSARAMAEDLRRFVDDVPTLAKPPSLAKKTLNWSKRNPAFIAVILAVSIVVGISSTLSSFLLRKETQRVTEQLRRAETAESIARSAEQEAKYQATRAERSALNAEGINRFLTDFVFAKADTSRLSSLGGANSLLAALDDATRYADSQFPNDPELKGALYQSIGQLFSKLGEFEKSREVFERALILLNQAESQDAIGHRKLQTLIALGHARIELGQLAEAASMFREILRQSHTETEQGGFSLGARLGLARTLLELDNIAEAKHWAQESYRTRSEAFGLEAPETAVASIVLAKVLLAEQEFDPATELLSHAASVLRRTHGIEDLDCQRAVEALAKVRRLQGDFAAAEKLLREIYEARLRIHGPEHTVTLHAMDDLAQLLETEGRLAEAEDLLRELGRIQNRLFGFSKARATFDRLMLLLAKLGRTDRFDELLALQSEVGTPRDSSGVRSSIRYADLLLATGMLVEAEQLLRQTLESAEQTLGEGEPNTVACRWRLVFSLLAQRKIHEGAELGRTTISYGYDDNTDGQAEQLAMLFIASGEANPWTESMLRESLAHKRNTLAKSHPSIALTLAVLAQDLILNGRFEEARYFLEEALKIRTTALHESNWLIAETKSLLGQCLIHTGRNDEAKSLLEEAYRAIAQNANLLPHHKSEFIERLLQFEMNQGKSPDSEKWHSINASLLRSTLAEWKSHVPVDNEDYLKTAVRLGKSLAAMKDFGVAEEIHLAALAVTELSAWNQEPHSKLGRMETAWKLRMSLVDLYKAWGTSEKEKAFSDLIASYERYEDEVTQRADDPSIALWLRLSDEYPRSLYRFRLAKSYADAARFDHQNEMYEDAVSRFESSIEVIDSVLVNDAKNIWGIGCKAMVLMSLAKTLEASYRGEEALAALEEATRLGNRLKLLDLKTQPSICSKASAASDVLAMYLANCLEPAFRDPQRALQLANLKALSDSYSKTALALAHYRLKHFDEVIALLKDDSIRYAQLVRAMAYFGAGDKERAQLEFESAFSSFALHLVVIEQDNIPGNRVALTARLVKEAANTLQIVGSEFDCLEAYWRGKAFLRREDSLKAEEAFRRAVHLKPDHADSYLGISQAIVERNGNDVDDGIEAVHKYLECKEKGEKTLDPKAYTLLGVLHALNGESELAFESMQRAVQLEPRQASAYSGIARAFEEYADYASVTRAFEEALRVAPEDLGLVNNLAWFYANCPEVAHRDFSRAVKLATSVTENAPTAAAGWNTLGVALFRSGEYERAITALKQSIELSNQETAYDMLFLAMSYKQMNNLLEAEEWHQRAIAWKENNPVSDKDLVTFFSEAEQMFSRGGPSS